MPLFTNILFPVDFSDRSRAAAPFVLSLGRHYQSKVTLLHVIQPPPIYPGMNNIDLAMLNPASLQGEFEQRLREFAATELPKVDVRCTVEVGDPAIAIVSFVEREKCDLVAMPTHGYGTFRRALLGSVTAKVLNDSAVPVWTTAHAPEPSHRAHPKPRRILAALDLKPESRRTLEMALEIAAESEATIEMVHAAPEGETKPLNPENRLHELLAETARAQLVNVFEESAPDVEVVTDGGSVAHLVRDVALRKRVDLVVIGRGRAGSGMRLKTNTYGIIREAPCPVLSV
jgi:nucleotide-binding universal stress UspA family protein